MIRTLLALPLLLAAFADARAGAPEAPPAGRSFGAAIELERATPLAEVLAAPERFADEPLLVRGRIAEVCQKKGCWTLLQDGDAVVRVRFEDYAFFLPRDCAGDEALVQGRVRLRTLSEAEARHYAAETRGGDPERIRGPQREVGLLASGVRLLPAAAPAGP
jgi:hypothetical protein